MPQHNFTTYAGLDYSLGWSNFNPETGIHFGVISQNSINWDCSNDWQYDYGSPSCPKCTGTVKEIPTHTASSDPPGKWVSIISDVPEAYEDYIGSGSDYACESCKILWDSGDCIGDGAIGWSYEGDGYKLTDCLNNDIFVLDSLYFTYAQFCNPCVPGAGNLDSPMDAGSGVKTYCLGPKYFDEFRPMPYACFRVNDGTEVSDNA
jgi:hypothetical protein